MMFAGLPFFLLPEAGLNPEEVTAGAVSPPALLCFGQASVCPFMGYTKGGPPIASLMERGERGRASLQEVKEEAWFT